MSKCFSDISILQGDTVPLMSGVAELQGYSIHDIHVPLGISVVRSWVTVWSSCGYARLFIFLSNRLVLVQERYNVEEVTVKTKVSATSG
ncbi:hypothetical protein FRX31_026428 [Thalictrum thalictroides]|uniref:Uncharacterized protein n=1 Tax=Thalictrum thalictroides TaxID=46969 RepID=A0A7J6VFU6_THATH|nr:hypothetical protein FRX31_026428 [Thalictrum thalictroides]